MTSDRLALLRGKVERGELGAGPATTAIVSELLDAYDDLARQEAGACSVACEALGVSYDAVRATARSRADQLFGPPVNRRPRPEIGLV